MPRSRLLVPLIFIAFSAGAEPAPSTQPTLIEVKRIWDQSPYNAFTDLIRFKGSWYCAFREATKHVSPDGALRIIRSNDGVSWQSIGLLKDDNADLRDPKFAITPSGRLMLTTAAALHNPTTVRHQSMIWFSDDGEHWIDPQKIGPPNQWLWRFTWHKGVVYSIGYDTNPERPRRATTLYTGRETPTGLKLETLVDPLVAEGSPGEHGMLFLPDQTAVVLLRRDTGPRTALLGAAPPPYTQWTWHDAGKSIGGPELLQLPDGTILAATRLFKANKPYTALSRIDLASHTLVEVVALPSGGDCSYPGMVLHDRMLWVSYYSSHEAKPSIYLAKVAIPTPSH